MGEWLRKTVGITDPDKPFYSLRHSGITICGSPARPMGRSLSTRTFSGAIGLVVPCGREVSYD